MITRVLCLGLLFSLACSNDSASPDLGDGGPIDTDGGIAGDGSATATLEIQPSAVTVPAGRKQSFVAEGAATWQVMEGATGGTVDARGVYTAPTTPGVYHVLAVKGSATGIATVTVADYKLSVLAGTLGGNGYRDATGADARFRQATGVIGDGAGSIYVADRFNAVIRKIDVATGTTTTIAGSPQAFGALDGTGAGARFYNVDQLAIDTSNHILYVLDGSAVRKVDLATQKVTTIAGSVKLTGSVNAVGTVARFKNPGGIAYDGSASLFVADTGNYLIRQIDLASGTVTTLAGSGAPGTVNMPGTLAQFQNVVGLAYDTGVLYLADAQSYQIRSIVVSTKAVATLAGSTSGYVDMSGTSAKFNIPDGIATDHAGNLYVSDAANYRIRKVVISTGAVSTVAGSGANGGITGIANGTGTAATFGSLLQVALEGGNLYVADYYAGSIRQVTLPGAVVTSLAGVEGVGGTMNGPGATARFNAPTGLSLSGSTITIMDEFNYALRRYDTSTMMVSAFSGLGTTGSADGAAGVAQFRQASSIVDDGAGGYYVSDLGGRTIRHVATDGSVTTPYGQDNVAVYADGNGTAATFEAPGPLVRVGQKLYVTDQVALRQIDLVSGDVTLVLGDPANLATSGYVDDVGKLARFGGIGGLASDGADTIYISDPINAVIRALTLSTSRVSTLPISDATGALAHFAAAGPLLVSSGSLYVIHGQYLSRVYLVTNKVDDLLGNAATIAVVPGPAATASLQNYTQGLAIDASGALFITSENALLRFGM